MFILNETLKSENYREIDIIICYTRIDFKDKIELLDFWNKIKQNKINGYNLYRLCYGKCDDCIMKKC